MHVYKRRDVTNLETNCDKSVHKLSTNCVRTACTKLLQQVWYNLLPTCYQLDGTIIRLVPGLSKQDWYTCKNAQVATDLQTSCNKSVHKLLTRCICTACSNLLELRTSLEQAVDKL